MYEIIIDTFAGDSLVTQMDIKEYDTALTQAQNLIDNLVSYTINNSPVAIKRVSLKEI